MLCTIRPSGRTSISPLHAGSGKDELCSTAVQLLPPSKLRANFRQPFHRLRMLMIRLPSASSAIFDSSPSLSTAGVITSQLRPPSTLRTNSGHNRNTRTQPYKNHGQDRVNRAAGRHSKLFMAKYFHRGAAIFACLISSRRSIWRTSSRV